MTSPGARLVQEWVNDRSLGDDGMLSPNSHVDNIDTDDLARRIDAALAEAGGVLRTAALRKADEAIAAKMAERRDADAATARAEAAETALAEREAQITTLTERWTDCQRRLVQYEAHGEEVAGIEGSIDDCLLHLQAQIAALWDVLKDVQTRLTGACWCVQPPLDAMEDHEPRCRAAREIVSDVDTTARAFVERIQAAERERVLTQIEEGYGATGRMIVANIRLQPPRREEQ